MNAELPQMPETPEGSLGTLPQMDIFSGMEESMLQVDGVREAVREAIIQQHGIDADHVKDGTMINLEAWKEHASWKERAEVYIQAVVGETIFKLFSEGLDLDDKTKEKGEMMVPEFEDFIRIQSEQGTISLTTNRNVMMRGDRGLQKTIARGSSLFELMEGFQSNGSEVDKEFVQQMLHMQWPKGSTVVIPEKKSSGEDRSITFMRQVIELTGVDMNVMSPSEKSIASAMGANEVRLVLVPNDSLPRKNGEIDLDSLDNLVDLYARGDAVWYAPEMAAAALVRMGTPVEEAIQATGFTPGLDPTEAERYSFILDQLNTIPAQGAPSSTNE